MRTVLRIRRYLKPRLARCAASRLAKTIVQDRIPHGNVAVATSHFADPAPGEGSLVADYLLETPPIIHRDDPRVEELVLNAFKFANPTGRLKSETRDSRMWDSIIIARLPQGSVRAANRR